MLTIRGICIVTPEPGSYRDGSTVKRLGALAEDLGSFLRPMYHLAAACHSSSRVSNAPFWLLVLTWCLSTRASTRIYIKIKDK